MDSDNESYHGESEFYYPVSLIFPEIKPPTRGHSKEISDYKS